MKERQRQLREDAILDAATELLEQKGYDAMTLEDITEAIGISRPTLYQHFRSKEDVVLHISLRCLQQFSDFLNAQDPTQSATQRLFEFCDHVFDRRFGPQRIAFSDMMRVISARQADSRLAELEGALMHSYVQLGFEAQAEGGVRSDLTSMFLSQTVVGLAKNDILNDLISQGEMTIQEVKDGVRKLMLPL